MQNTVGILLDFGFYKKCSHSMILDVTFKSYLHLLSWWWWPIGRVLRLWRWECVRLLWVSSWCLLSGHKSCAADIIMIGKGLWSREIKTLPMLQGARKTFGSRSQIVLVQELRARFAMPAVTSEPFWAITKNVGAGGNWWAIYISYVTCCCIGMFWVITVVWGPKEWTVPLVGDEIWIEEIEIA